MDLEKANNEWMIENIIKLTGCTRDDIADFSQYYSQYFADPLAELHKVINAFCRKPISEVMEDAKKISDMSVQNAQSLHTRTTDTPELSTYTLTYSMMPNDLDFDFDPFIYNISQNCYHRQEVMRHGRLFFILYLSKDFLFHNNKLSLARALVWYFYFLRCPKDKSRVRHNKCGLLRLRPNMEVI